MKKRRKKAAKPDKGFTLIEIVITISIGAILSAFVVQVMSSVLYRSPEPLNAVVDEALMENIMEEIIADYVKEINANPDDALNKIKNVYVYPPAAAMEYIKFDAAGQMQPTAPDTSPTLMVTVEINGRSLTALLTKSRKTDADRKIRY